MYKHLREVIQSITKNNRVPPKEAISLAVTYKKSNEACNIDVEVPENFEVSKNSENLQGESLRRDCQDQRLNVATILAEKFAAPFRNLLPGIPHLNYLENLTDLRTADEGLYRAQAIGNDNLQPKPRCQEQPRQFILGEFVTGNMTERSSTENLQQQSQTELSRSKGIELEMQKMMCNILNQKELRIKKNKEVDNLDNHSYLVNIDTVIEKENAQRSGRIATSNSEHTSPSKMLDLSTTISQQKHKLETELINIFKNVLKARELSSKEFESNKIQNDKTVLIDINTVIENEEKNRGEKTIRDRSITGNTVEEDEIYDFKELKINGNDKTANSARDADQLGKTYFDTVLEMNRILENKMMKPKEKTPFKEFEKSYNLKEVQQTFRVKFGNAQILKPKVESDNDFAKGNTPNNTQFARDMKEKKSAVDEIQESEKGNPSYKVK